MAIRNLDKWTPNPLAFGSIQSVGPFSTPVIAMMEGIPHRIDATLEEFSQQKSYATIDSYIVVNPPNPFTITLNEETFEFKGIVEEYLGESDDKYDEKFYCLWKYKNDQWYISGPSDYLVNFAYENGYCVFNPSDIPKVNKPEIVRFTFADFTNFIYKNIYPTFLQYKTASQNGNQQTYNNNLNNLCSAWLVGFKQQPNYNPAYFNPVAADFLDMLLQMWQADISGLSDSEIMAHACGTSMEEFDNFYPTLYSDWGVQYAVAGRTDPDLNRRLILKYYDTVSKEYLIKNIINVNQDKYTIEEVENNEYICVNEVNGAWNQGEIIKERTFDISAWEWGLGDVAREMHLELGLLDLLKVIKVEPRLLGGDMAAIMGTNQEPEGEGFGAGGSDLGAKEWPKFRFGEGFTYSPKRYEIWEISEGEFSIRYYENKESNSYIVLPEKFNNLEKAIEKARSLANEIYKDEIKQKDLFQRPDIYYQRETSDGKYVFNLSCTGMLEFGVKLTIQRQLLFATTYPETLKSEEIEIEEIKNAKSFTSALLAKQNLPPNLLENWRKEVDKYVGEYNSEAGINAEDYDTFFGATNDFSGMAYQTYIYAKNSIKNVLMGSVIGLGIAAPFLIIIWGAYFALILAMNYGGI